MLVRTSALFLLSHLVAAAKWSCIPGLMTPVRIASNGNIECWSNNGVDCINDCVALVASNTEPTKPVTCGCKHLSAWNTTGYYDANGNVDTSHWCNLAKDVLGANPPNPKCTKWNCLPDLMTPVRISVDGNVECWSDNGIACVNGCPALVASNTDPKLPLVCGCKHFAIWNITGYNDASGHTDPLHWCNLAKNALGAKPPSPTCVLANDQSASNLPSVSTGAVIGIAVAGLAVVAIAATCYVRLSKKARGESSAPGTASMFVLHDAQLDSKTPNTMGSTQLTQHTTEYLDMRDLELYRIKDKEIQVNHIMGSGAFANVWCGTYQGEPVAIKQLQAKNISMSQLQSFLDEIHLMSTFDSPYIVKFIGAAWKQPKDMMCVMELMDGGDLRDYLTKHNAEDFPWADKLVHIQRIAEALVYLHSQNIIHRDLKSRNVLLDSKKGTKLTDFGVSKEDMEATMTMGVGTFRWMAPEVIKSHKYSVASDIYSFGIVVSEFATHLIPYFDQVNPENGQRLGDMPIMVKVVAGELTPSFGTGCPEWLLHLATKCLAFDPDARPTSMQLSHHIRMQLRQAYSVV
ncbi:Aste57867_3228 [Aphanomyces stellatus]|uniref:Aste57867_3228 protein n=1 Tax=Aphanomyces stellatus TaxID=120398 RepID=A0A485KAY2_9STRA|nr:hypothetical protein As57867_003218 [Aphanomyces stellatus]VFT80402.1 Aste57867_3228 [Aphanomyces stellatus]